MGCCQSRIGNDLAGGEEMTKPEVLAIIPARAGSKGIPRKNIRLFAGHPLVAYSIAAGLQAKTVTRVMVTTDDDEIARVARSYGAETPFLRPLELAGDRTLDLPVFQHALNWLAEHENYHPDAVVHLRPTTPFRPPDLVDRAIHILLEHPGADSVRGLTLAQQNPFKMWLMESEEKPIHPLMTVPEMDESYNAPRQTLPIAYAHNGLIDIIRSATILKQNSMSGKIILPVLFDPVYSADLDTIDDWRRAEERLLVAGPLMVWPGDHRRTLPKKIDLLVLDFDGVLTDNRVWVDQDGHEMVAANRSDSLGVNMLRQAGVETVVISKETNPVVAARCRKMEVECIQGENDKETALKQLLAERGVDPGHVVYCGNDANDLPCFPLVGWAVAVADSVPEVVRKVDFVLTQPGGHGAVRELCGLILSANQFKYES
jgi:YrbI family 3-deoxy-D-manno-octulosonate 8-phosphate phosphatase